jgi:hypothetical protein
MLPNSIGLKSRRPLLSQRHYKRASPGHELKTAPSVSKTRYGTLMISAAKKTDIFQPKLGNGVLDVSA